MEVTPDALPGLDQITVPRVRAPAETVTSADAVPAVIVACPAARAERSGGSSLDRLTTSGSLDVHVSPVAGCPAGSNAWIVRLSPATKLSVLGTTVLPPDTGTVKPTALLRTPFCFILAMPVRAVRATAATTRVSLQLSTWPSVRPNKTLPFPWEGPKPVPVIVTEVPGPPDNGLTPVIWSVFTLNGTALLQTPFCRTWALPEVDPPATRATTWVSLQNCTSPFKLPSHTWPLLPREAPKPEPVIVTRVPGSPPAGVTLEIVAVSMLKVTALDHVPPCCTRTVPDLELEATVATTCVSLQLSTVPDALPSQTAPVPRNGSKPEPEMVTCAPAEPTLATGR